MIWITPVVYWWWFHRLWLVSAREILVLQRWHQQYIRKHKDINRMCLISWRESSQVSLPGIFFSLEGCSLASAGHKFNEASLAFNRFSSSKSSHSFPRSKHTVGIWVNETLPQWVFETAVDIFEWGPVRLIPAWWVSLSPSVNPGKTHHFLENLQARQ